MVLAVYEVGLPPSVDDLFGGDHLLGRGFLVLQEDVFGRFLTDFVEGIDENVAAGHAGELFLVHGKTHVMDFQIFLIQFCLCL